MAPKTNNRAYASAEKATKKEREKRKERQHVIEVSGLCVSCATAETCSYRTNSRGPVHFCEEFDSGLPLAQTKFRKITTPISHTKHPVDAEGLKGLCVNCDNRGTCSHARTESGVWHCENYL
jgi:hypothetical protein